MRRSEVKEIFLNYGKIAKDIKETYFITSDGSPINLGSRINCCNGLERTVEHNSIFYVFKLKMYEWGKFFKITGVVGVCPENKTAFCNGKQKLTKKQLSFIKNNKLSLIRDGERF